MAASAEILTPPSSARTPPDGVLLRRGGRVLATPGRVRRQQAGADVCCGADDLRCSFVGERFAVCFLNATIHAQNRRWLYEQDDLGWVGCEQYTHQIEPGRGDLDLRAVTAHYRNGSNLDRWRAANTSLSITLTDYLGRPQTFTRGWGDATIMHFRRSPVAGHPERIDLELCAVFDYFIYPIRRTWATGSGPNGSFAVGTCRPYSAYRRYDGGPCIYVYCEDNLDHPNPFGSGFNGCVGSVFPPGSPNFCGPPPDPQQYVQPAEYYDNSVPGYFFLPPSPPPTEQQYADAALWNLGATRFTARIRNIPAALLTDAQFDYITEYPSSRLFPFLDGNGLSDRTALMEHYPPQVEWDGKRGCWLQRRRVYGCPRTVSATLASYDGVHGRITPALPAPMTIGMLASKPACFLPAEPQAYTTTGPDVHLAWG